MSIKLEEKEGLICPIIYCDECGDRIKISREANFEWSWDMKKTRYVHKVCSRRYREEFPMSIDLDEHMYLLLKNVKYSQSNGKKHYEFGMRIS